MPFNPEFRRNLWLELTVHRLIAMPALLLLVLALVYAASDEWVENVAQASALIAAALLGIWGVRAAADCVTEEVRDRTWDGQRMSAIGPWAMTWSKLFGASAFAWYGASMALAVLVCIAPRWAQSSPKVAALIVAGCLLLQGAACLAGLHAARRGMVRQGAVGMLLIVLFLMLLGPASGLLGDGLRQAVWWRMSFDLLNFVLASATLFAAWAIFGVYRVMCGQLQVRTTPWAFVGFVLFVTFYLAGFWIRPDTGAALAANFVYLIGLVVAASLTYLQLFSERTGVIAVRRLQVRLARREWRRSLEELPCWAAGFALTGVFCALALLFFERTGALARLALAPLPLFLLLARDIGIFLVFAFARQPRRVEAAVLFYLVLLYGILPWLVRAAGMSGVAELILPPLLTAPGRSAIIAAVQLAIVAALVFRRWRANRLSESRA